MNRRKLLLAALLSSLAFGGGIGLTISSGWLITMAATHPPILTLTVAIVGVRFFGISRSLFRYAERLMSHKSVFDALTTLRSRLFHIVAHQPISSMRRLLGGAFAKTLVDDVERAQEYQLRNVLPGMSTFISVTMGSALALWIEPRTLWFIIPAALIFLFVIPVLSRASVFAPSRELERDENKLSELLAISSSELREASMYGYIDQLKNVRQEKIQAITGRERSIFARIGILQGLTILALGGALVASAWIARSLDNPPDVRITMVIFIPLVIYEAVTAWFPGLFTSGKLLRAQASVDEISRLAITAEGMERKPLTSSCALKDVTVSWGVDFMRPVSAIATPATPLVIAGENGSGKSTLALGACGLLPYQGSIQVCDVEITQVSNREDFIVGALQQSHIFNTSVRENLKIADEGASDEQIRSVLEIVELDHLDLDEVLGEFGRGLSGGESKRLGVARALLSHAPVVILDEPLEHLDSERAQRIEARILEFMKDRTLIVIAHSGWAELENRLLLQN